MTTNTTPSPLYFISDTSGMDTITVSDGPATNGFQTSKITTATDTIILANQSAITIDGSEADDSVVLDNPHPAAGLLSLIIQDLGPGGSTGSITGGNPNANGFDIAVATLTLSAPGGIGANRALRTQVSTLSATAGTGAGAGGNINIANGSSAAPATLNIVTLQADTDTAGQNSITLTNNGTINDYTAASPRTAMSRSTRSAPPPISTPDRAPGLPATTARSSTGAPESAKIPISAMAPGSAAG